MKSVRSLIDGFVWNHIEYFSEMVYEGGKDTEFMNVRVLDDPEKFVCGALSCAEAALCVHYFVTKDKRAEVSLKRLVRFLSYTSESDIKTWGKLSTLKALVTLKRAGLLNKIGEEQLSVLKEKTDYSDFFDKETLTLKGAPTNYLQVAMSCAGLRNILGWEDGKYCRLIAGKLMAVMSRSSSEGWMDEQPPYGRFDRYSLIISSEMSGSLQNLGLDFPQSLSENLKKASDFALFSANNRGDGINFGRSLSCHGDCATAEILSSALARRLIENKDITLAVAYAIRIIEKTLNFWYDSNRKSFNIWWDGRSTNNYRQVHRVLEVNLDMAMHLISTLNNFTAAGLDNCCPEIALPSPGNWICREVNFEKHPGCKYSLYTLRYGDITAMLPLTGLGNNFKNSGYMPYPAICGFLEAAPEAKMPFLTPEFVLKNGKRARPVQFFTDSFATTTSNGVKITAVGKLCSFEGKIPEALEETFKSEYRFENGTITALFTADAEIESVSMVIGIHRADDEVSPVNFDITTGISTDGVYDFMTPHGPVVSAWLCSGKSSCVGYLAKIK